MSPLIYPVVIYVALAGSDKLTRELEQFDTQKACIEAGWANRIKHGTVLDVDACCRWKKYQRGFTGKEACMEADTAERINRGLVAWNRKFASRAPAPN